METFQERLADIKQLIDDDIYRKRVLLLCQQNEPKSFDEYSKSGSFRRLEKFESSTYSEVLKAIDLADNNKPVVMKIMRALTKDVIKRMPSITTKGCQSYNDILNELVVTQALSQLHDGVILNGQPNSLYRTHFFCLIHEIKVVSGNLDLMLHADDANNKNRRKSAPPDAASPVDATLGQLPEEERMLMEALPREYVVSVMRHDGQPLWWWMTHKELTPSQLISVLIQTIVGLAIAENIYLYEHRDLHVSNILIKRTTNESIPFILDGQRYNITSYGIKATIIDATFSRLTHNGKVYFRDLTSTLRAYSSKKTPTRMSLQNRSYRQMVRVTRNKWDDFTPKTNLIWLTYLCETLMKNDILKGDQTLWAEVKKVRDYTLKVKTTLDLLSCFPFERMSKTTTTEGTNTTPAAPVPAPAPAPVPAPAPASNHQPNQESQSGS